MRGICCSSLGNIMSRTLLALLRTDSRHDHRKNGENNHKILSEIYLNFLFFFAAAEKTTEPVTGLLTMHATNKKVLKAGRSVARNITTRVGIWLRTCVNVPLRCSVARAKPDDLKCTTWAPVTRARPPSAEITALYSVVLTSTCHECAQ